MRLYPSTFRLPNLCNALCSYSLNKVSEGLLVDTELTEVTEYAKESCVAELAK
jgi:hypothetical protein